MDSKSINIETLSKKYNSSLQQDMEDGRNGGDLQISFENLKLQILPGSIKWTPTAPQAEYAGLTRKVRVENKTTGSEVFGNLQTSRESEMYVKVTLTSGLVKGLNKMTRLPLPAEIRDKLGANIKFDPSKPESGVLDKMNISVTSGHEIPPGTEAAATATVSCKEEEYEGRFQCTASLHGNVIFKSQSGESTSTDVTEIFKGYTMNGVTIKDQDQDQEINWTMEGSCALRWDFEQKVTWN